MNEGGYRCCLTSLFDWAHCVATRSILCIVARTQQLKCSTNLRMLAGSAREFDEGGLFTEKGSVDEIKQAKRSKARLNLFAGQLVRTKRHDVTPNV